MKQRHFAILIAAMLIPAASVGAQDADHDARPGAFESDLRALTRASHRLAGTDANNAAADHVVGRLKEIGVPDEDIISMGMDVWQTHVDRCDITVGEETASLTPLRPNLTVTPSTSADGIRGRLLYAGTGELSEYGERSPNNAIVVLDYACGDNWLRAFSMGAQAVVFTGDVDDVAQHPKHVKAPANLPRYYASPEVAERLNLREDRAEATIVSHVRWELRPAKNVIAILPGTDPIVDTSRAKAEAIVLSANLDSFGEVPRESPDARGAANVAALLDAAAHFQVERPRRDVVLMFVNNRARYHQGARAVYSAMLADEDKIDELHADHRRERETLDRVLALVQDEISAAEAGDEVVEFLMARLKRYAGYASEDVSQETVSLRLPEVRARRRRQALEVEMKVLRAQLAKDAELMTPDERVEAERRLEALPGLIEDLKHVTDKDTQQQRLELRGQVAVWDEMRRTLNDVAPDRFDDAFFDQLAEDAAQRARRKNAQLFGDVEFKADLGGELRQDVIDAVMYRLNELDAQIASDEQVVRLRRRLSDRWISLHVDYNFADGNDTWAVVAGDSSRLGFPAGAGDADAPGFYKPILRGFRDALERIGDSVTLAPESVNDATIARRYVPGRFVSNGIVAGTYGIYNVALMTAHDARTRDGHPSDTIENLDWRGVLRQVREAHRVLGLVADGEAISHKRQFKAQVMDERPMWNADRASGPLARMMVTGSLAEDRPAVGAVVAVWPCTPNTPWPTLSGDGEAPAFDRFVLAPVNAMGRFPLRSLRQDVFRNYAMFGMLTDEAGRASAVTNASTLVHTGGGIPRIELFPTVGHVCLFPPMSSTQQQAELKVLRALADSAFLEKRTLSGQLDELGFFYTYAYATSDRVKVFQENGPVVLGVTNQAPYGIGKPFELFRRPPAITPLTAKDAWELNESRLATLRARGVPQRDLEQLHNRAAREQREAAEADSVGRAEAAYTRSTLRSRDRVYRPLRSAMDDLVHAVVILLLLTIPFAFALERLVFCATSVYRRLAGFALLFFITFLLLYFTHPGFAIATTPIMILLAFTIILLSSLVIYIIVRKFRTELKAIQGLSGKLHDLEVSRMGTLLAAVNMGMSTMRRRPTRTILTAVTVIMLTFTILSFASLTSELGVRAVYEGPVGDEAGPSIFLRQVDYTKMDEDVLAVLGDLPGEGGELTGQWWLTRRSGEPTRSRENTLPFSVVRPDTGQTLWLDGVMGLQPEELQRRPAFRSLLAGDASEQVDMLKRRGVYLPLFIAEQLALEPGQQILFNGYEAVYAGSADARALQRAKQLDGQSVMPVDFIDLAAASQGQDTAQAEAEAGIEDVVQRDFTRLSPDQVAITSADFVREMGGDLHVLAMFQPQDADTLATAGEIAELIPVPVWARGAEGVERMFFTRLISVSGGAALVVPVLLGGMIIFGTLLGSISDREREIYTFSALGLAPKHVGFLFFAEAAVYAIVGGLGGQLLAQLVALGASQLADMGLIDPPSINYSSTNALFAIAIVMATVLVSAVYPAMRASKSANPGLVRSWRMPAPEGDELRMKFPFTVSAYDITGVISFLAEYFRQHEDAGLGHFAAQEVEITKDENGNLRLVAQLALAPFDLGVTQRFLLTATPSEIRGVDEVEIECHRLSGAGSDWIRSNRVFIQDLRRQFLLWRTLSTEMIEAYRLQTLQVLGEADETSDQTSETSEASA